MAFSSSRDRCPLSSASNRAKAFASSRSLGFSTRFFGLFASLGITAARYSRTRMLGARRGQWAETSPNFLRKKRRADSSSEGGVERTGEEGLPT
eukprot:scaffold39099_cov63-Phaeocystis_antarctica.AAC.2